MKSITKISLIALFLCGFSVMNAQVPTYTPPALEYDAEDVLSFVSDNYPDARDLTTPNWGAVSKWSYSATADATDDTGLVILLSGMDEEIPAGETATLYEWVAIQLTPLVETKAYEYFHIDVYCNEETDFRVGMHSNYPVNAEVYYPAIAKGTMVPGKWYSIDYPIADLKYAEGDNSETAAWIGDNEAPRNANLLRFGNGPDIFDYSGGIYVTNMLFFNGEPTCLGGVVRDQESSINYVKDDNSFSASIKNGKLNYNAAETIGQVNVYSVTGQLAASFDANNTSGSYDVSDMASGVYVISASVGNSVVTKKAVK